jgi:hypothetical protein
MFKLRRVFQIVCSVAVAGTIMLTGHSATWAEGIERALTGSGHFTGSNGELVTFSYSAVLYGNGTVSGHYQIDLRSLDASFHGPITCLSVAGNRAWVGGIAEQVRSSNPNLAALQGNDMWFQVQDNGEGVNDPPDRTTSIGVTPVGGPPGQAQAYCAAMPAPITFRPIEEGNIQVHSDR